MLFNSAAFLFLFLPLVLVGVFNFVRRRSDGGVLWLCLASFAFYAYWDWRYLPLLLASIIGNYVAGRGILAARANGRQRGAKLALTLGLAGNLALLGFFKCARFFAATAMTAIGWPTPDLGVVLPLGISFFTFTQIAFLVDAYRGRVSDLDPAGYALFVSYFPHLIAGPILHHAEMMPQFARRDAFRFDWSNIAVGLTIFSIGLFKKVVLADGVAHLVGPVFDAAAAGQGVLGAIAWQAALAYTLQLYFDFSGYSDMAIGLSRLIGIQLPLNFNAPYKATSIIEFWRRWHMTLSRFLRDYLYFPLGGNRLGATRRYANLMAVMLLGGLWHGAGWTFVFWGGLHGVYLLANHLWRSAFGKERIPFPLARFLTFLAVLFAWVMFRADSLQAALAMWRAMLSADSLAGNALDWSECAILLAVVWLAPTTQQIMARFRPGLETDHIARSRWSWQPRPITAVASTVLLGACLYLILFTHRVSDFLYFQF